LEVVVYEGVIREKPSSKEEARQFLKGLLNVLF
jgi:predicted house-cleaning NTP pyrophosphatase (Maf/HAM1 superfamily)